MPWWAYLACLMIGLCTMVIAPFVLVRAFVGLSISMCYVPFGALVVLAGFGLMLGSCGLVAIFIYTYNEWDLNQSKNEAPINVKDARNPRLTMKEDQVLRQAKG